jgi:Uma2 family endonuclease
MDVAKTIDGRFEDPIAPDLTHLITEDDKPVDNRYSERQFKLLSLPLFDSWDEGKPFEALSDVGLFYTPSNDSVVVPDFLLSLGVEPKKVSEGKETHSYFVWLYGKPPNLVVEVVSNKKGGELDRKMEIYEKIGVSYYAVHDPLHQLGKRELRLFKLEGGKYVEMADPTKMPELRLGFRLWEGSFLDVEDRWLRFVDADGELILTGTERAALEGERADEESKRADEESKRADQAEARAQELERRLRELEGI